jgi:hypothetical protein
MGQRPWKTRPQQGPALQGSNPGDATPVLRPAAQGNSTLSGSVGYSNGFPGALPPATIRCPFRAHRTSPSEGKVPRSDHPHVGRGDRDVVPARAVHTYKGIYAPRAMSHIGRSGARHPRRPAWLRGCTTGWCPSPARHGGLREATSRPKEDGGDLPDRS